MPDAFPPDRPDPRAGEPPAWPGAVPGPRAAYEVATPPGFWPPSGQNPGAHAPGWPGAPSFPPPGNSYPGPATPKRSRAATIVSVVTAVVILACLGFGTAAFFAVRELDTGRPAAEPRPTNRPTDLRTDIPEQPGSGPIHRSDLPHYLIRRPATAHAWPKVKADQALDLTMAAASLPNPAEGRLVLQRYGFHDGYDRRWIDEDGNLILVRLLRFADATSGQNYANFYVNACRAGGWGDPTSILYAPGGSEFIKPTPEQNGVQRTLAVYDAGDIVVVVFADQTPPARAATLESLLEQQVSML